MKSLKPLVKIISWASVGVDPSLMGLGPIEAVRMALKKANSKINDVDLFEINEAFAAVALTSGKIASIDEEKVNVHGGAVALGHPIGASGARILVTLVHAMKRYNKKRGVAAICIGGGEALAVLVELVK